MPIWRIKLIGELQMERFTEKGRIRVAARASLQYTTHVIVKGPPPSAKMKALILHIAAASAADEKCGAVKLNKILFYADFLSFYKRGKSITGQEYFALREGPAPQQFVPIREEMEKEDKSIAIQTLDCGFGNPMSRIVALRSPDYSHLDAEDVAIVDFVMVRLRSLNGTETSNLSHKFKGWDAAFKSGPKTMIPYESVYLDPAGFWNIELPQLPDEQVEIGRTLWAKIAAA